LGVEAKSTLSPENTVPALSIAPNFPFGGVVPGGQEVFARLDGSAEALIRFEINGAVTARCSNCLRPAPAVHRQRLRRVRDLSLAHATVNLLVPHRVIRCPSCGIRAEDLEFLSPFRRSTRRFERAVADLCRVLPIKHVAEHFGISWHAAKEIDKRRLEREIGPPDYDGLRLLAVDEIAVHKGHRYMTSVLNVETGAIVWMGHGREKATLLRFFAELTPQQRNGIQAIATDMASAYREAIDEAVPHVAQVYDLFHVVAKYSREVIDRVRIDESKRMGSEAGRRLIKGSRYLLLRNQTNLSTDQQDRLHELLCANERLNTVHILKDQLKKIWSYKSSGWARRALIQWCALAAASGIRALQAFALNLRRHESRIVAHGQFPLHTGQLEGMHNKIKFIKRQAYGFRDDDYFILKVKAAFHPNLR
jgi:transposase